MASISQKDNNVVENGVGMVCPATLGYTADAIEALKCGKVVAVPTYTLYGFACDACSREAINRIYEMKGRKHTSLLAICVGDVLDTKLFAVIADLPDGLLNSLLPGPVTMVLRRGCGSALALKSANLSGRPSSFCIEDFESSWEHCAYVYDGGELPSDHVGSTVVDLTKLGNYMILRSGSAGEETIAILKRHSLQEEARVVESLVIGSRLQGSVK